MNAQSLVTCLIFKRSLNICWLMWTKENLESFWVEISTQALNILPFSHSSTQKYLLSTYYVLCVLLALGKELWIRQAQPLPSMSLQPHQGGKIKNAWKVVTGSAKIKYRFEVSSPLHLSPRVSLSKDGCYFYYCITIKIVSFPHSPSCFLICSAKK